METMPSYDPKDIIPTVDENGKFFDFILKNGQNLITDYSHMRKEIIVQDNIISFGDKKCRHKILSLDELKAKAVKLILSIYEAYRSFNVHVLQGNASILKLLSETHYTDARSENVEEKRKKRNIVICETVNI